MSSNSSTAALSTTLGSLGVILVSCAAISVLAPIALTSTAAAVALTTMRALTLVALPTLFNSSTLSVLIGKGALPQLKTGKDFCKSFFISIVPVTLVCAATVVLSSLALSLPIAVAVIAKIALYIFSMVATGLTIYGLTNLFMPISHNEQLHELKKKYNLD